jgi:rhomboid family GlyGly-CTERM serine protease
MSVFSAQNNNHGSIALPWFTLSLAAVLTGLFALFGPMPDELLWYRIDSGQQDYWRYLTGHFVHTDSEHLAWNVGALLVIGGTLEALCGLNAFRQTTLIVFSTLTISAGIHWFQPELDWYAGFSGILNAYFILFLWSTWRQYRHMATIITAVGLVIKIVIETMVGSSLIGAGTFAVVPVAHAVGTTTGVLVIVTFAFKNHSFMPNKH